jgi:hypothetical protein
MLAWAPRHLMLEAREPERARAVGFGAADER